MGKKTAQNTIEKTPKRLRNRDRYRCVSVAIWRDEKFRTLSHPNPCGQYLFLYLLTHPAADIPGFIPRGELALAEELSWPVEALSKALNELVNLSMIAVEKSARFVWIKNAIQYNPPASPNVCVFWARSIIEINECDLLNIAIKEVMNELKAFGKPYVKAFSKALPKSYRKAYAKAFGNQEQEQEQEQEQVQENVPPPYPPLTGGDRTRHPKPKPKPKSKTATQPTTPDSPLAQLKRQWIEEGLDKTERASQGWLGNAIEKRIASLLTEIPPGRTSPPTLAELKATIHAYALKIKQRQDWRVGAVMFSTFFGPQKRLWLEFLQGVSIGAAPARRHSWDEWRYRLRSKAEFDAATDEELDAILAYENAIMNAEFQNYKNNSNASDVYEQPDENAK